MLVFRGVTVWNHRNSESLPKLTFGILDHLLHRRIGKLNEKTPEGGSPAHRCFFGAFWDYIPQMRPCMVLTYNLPWISMIWSKYRTSDLGKPLDAPGEKKQTWYMGAVSYFCQETRSGMQFVFNEIYRHPFAHCSLNTRGPFRKKQDPTGIIVCNIYIILHKSIKPYYIVYLHKYASVKVNKYISSISLTSPPKSYICKTFLSVPLEKLNSDDTGMNPAPQGRTSCKWMKAHLNFGLRQVRC